MVARLKDDSRANVISDRDGRKYRREDCIVEPGTGYLVHRNESDGEYSLTNHPANHISKYAHFGDPYGTKDSRPDKNWDQSQSLYLADDSGNILVDDNDGAIYI